MRKCDGFCSRNGVCRGDVTHVWSGPNKTDPIWDWWYCEAAIEADRAQGFTVETDEELSARLEANNGKA